MILYDYAQNSLELENAILEALEDDEKQDPIGFKTIEEAKDSIEPFPKEFKPFKITIIVEPL